MSRYFTQDKMPAWQDVCELPERWNLYKQLVGGVPEGLAVKRLMLGEHWALVEAECGMGLAMTVRGGAGMPRLDVPASQLELRDLAALSTSWNFLEASMGVAALNAWYTSKEALAPLDVIIEDGPNSSFNVYRDLIAGKRVTIVGHFPLIERLGDICDLTILERNPQQGDMPDPACEYIIAEQDYLFCTGITLQNKTLPRLLELAREGNTPVIMVGPSVVPSAVFFDYGVACLAGSICVPEREAELKIALEQGSHSGIFKHGLQKMRVEKPGWRS